MARALNAVLAPEELTVVVNVGDDEVVYGVHVSADVDTVLYTLAGIEGPDGWGIAGDTFSTMERLEASGEDTTFRLGDRDFALCRYRTARLAAGGRLHEIVSELREQLDVEPTVIPVTDDRLRKGRCCFGKVHGVVLQ